VEAGAADAAGEKKGDGDIFKQYGPLPVTYVTITAPVSQRLTRPLVGTSSPSLAANLSTSLQPTGRVCLPFHQSCPLFRQSLYVTKAYCGYRRAVARSCQSFHWKVPHQRYAWPLALSTTRQRHRSRCGMQVCQQLPMADLSWLKFL
jgi:hypothetical protein